MSGSNTVISISGVENQRWEQEPEGDLELSNQRPIFQKVSYPPRISLNGLLISLMATILLVTTGFMMVQLPSPLGWFAPPPKPLMSYTFQLPTALFLATLLGPFMGPMVIALFLVVGLVAFPIFANGGGLQYLTQPGFGYLLGVLMMAYPLSKRFHKAFQKQDNASRSLKILGQALAAVLMVHVVGIAYLVGLTLAHQIPFGELGGWILRLSVESAPYDIVATVTLLCLVRQVRLALWLALY
jgi:biotin transport system substrate-specific component